MVFNKEMFDKIWFSELLAICRLKGQASSHIQSYTEKSLVKLNQNVEHYEENWICNISFFHRYELRGMESHKVSSHESVVWTPRDYQNII